MCYDTLIESVSLTKNPIVYMTIKFWYNSGVY